MHEVEFVQRIEEALLNDLKIDRKLAHSMFVGSPGSGKSSLMDRLLKRKRRQLSLSTGICDPVVIVDVSLDNPSTHHAVRMINPSTWEEIEYDISLVRQMDGGSIVTKSPVQAKRKNDPPAQQPTPDSQSVTFKPHDQKPTIQSHDHDLIEKPCHSKLSEGQIQAMIGAVIENCGGYEKFKNFLTKSFSLYLRDTGGQVEFQEMISLLIFGPSIFFFVFRMDLDFQSKFRIEYRTSASESINCYTSSITTEEALTQFLSSVYAMDTPGEAIVKTHKPLVFIIGTHKDQLGASAEDKITKLNEHLQSLIRRNGFQSLVQYADRKKGQVMFAVDNTSESDEEFKLIRYKFNSLVTGRKEFTIEYPMSYLLFCLELQSLKRSVLSLEECKTMAAKYGIVGDQVTDLLQFLHLRIGVIQYFNVKGLEHIVVKEPQVLFNRVTNLIIRTFSCEALTSEEQRNFEKGILTASVLESVLYDEGEITCKDFLKLLVHLRIITPFPSTSPGDQEERYFIPCVLNHMQESSEEDPPTNILPLCVSFECKHVPKGLFGVLVTHLMTPESEDEPDTSFILMEDKIYKDQVTFEVHSDVDVDQISLKMFPSHLEVNFFPSTNEDEEREQLLGEVCSNLRQILETSILRSLEALHYNRRIMHPVMSFRCEHCPDLHPVKRGSRVQFCRMYCSLMRRNVLVPSQGRPWFNEVVSSKDSAATSQGAPIISPYVSSLPASARGNLNQLLDWDHEGVDKDLMAIAHHMLDWEEQLSALLGLTQVDIHDIKEMHTNKPELQRIEALRRWKSKRGLGATYRNLLEAFEEAGHSRCAQALCDALKRRQTVELPSADMWCPCLQ